MPLEIYTNLRPSTAVRFSDGFGFYRGFKADPELKQEHNNPTPADELGISRKDGWKKPQSIGKVFRYVADEKTNSLVVYPADGGSPLAIVPMVGREKIDGAYIRNQLHIVNPIVATLGLFNPDIRDGEMVTPQHINWDGLKAVRDYVFSGGSAHASNTSVENSVSNPGKLDGLFGNADIMDTFGRNPQIMTNEMVKEVMRWIADVYSPYWNWVGTGVEPLKPEQRVAGALRDPSLLTEDHYIQARREQITYAKNLMLNPIAFPGIPQSGLSDDDNARIHCEIFRTFPGHILDHVLGPPFLPASAFNNLNVIARTTASEDGYPFGTKTSTPNLAAQRAYYDTIVQNDGRIFTGDDRDQMWLFAFGAHKQLEKDKLVTQGPSIFHRNGFRFVDDVNVNALLGYFGLNLHQTVTALSHLNDWYALSKKGKATEAEAHLQRYFEIMTPATGLSVDCFFGPMNPTSAYKHYLRLTMLMLGVIKEKHGVVLPSSRSVWDGEEEKLIAGRLLVWQLMAGAITIEEAKEIIKKLPHLFNAREITHAA